MNRKIEWIINQNWDEQTEPWIKLRYAVAAPVKRTPMNRLDLITFIDELIRIDTLRPKVLRDLLLKRVAKKCCFQSARFWCCRHNPLNQAFRCFRQCGYKR